MDFHNLFVIVVGMLAMILPLALFAGLMKLFTVKNLVPYTMSFTLSLVFSAVLFVFQAYNVGAEVLKWIH